MGGWIYDFRKELDSAIWLMPPMYHRVWQWIKYKVNHSPAKIPNKDGTFTTIKPGQHATSYRLIAKGVGYYEGLKWKEPNPKTIKVILNWLEVQEMISVKGNTLGTVITVLNWELYQKELVKGNTKETRKKHLLDTNNNDKEVSKKNKDLYSDFVKRMIKIYPGKKIKAIRDKKLPAILKKYSEEEIIRCVERYSKEVSNKEKQFIMNESTFWNGRYIDYLDDNYEEISKGGGVVGGDKRTTSKSGYTKEQIERLRG